MSDSWDSEEFVTPKKVVAVTDKWAGEDADDDVKDDWEQNDGNKEEEKGKEKEKTGGAYQRPKKKPLAERIAGKETKKKQMQEEVVVTEMSKKEMTPAERHSEKMRLRKVQEEADLRLAREAFGITDKKVSDSGIDSMFPSTEEEFVAFENALKTKITEFESSKFYASFLEKLFTDLTLGLQVEDCKKIGSVINSIHHEKEKQKKELEKKKKKKSKMSVNVERKDDFDFGVGGDYNAYEDDGDI
ncbi:eukaryotic translation initiation factor 3 subunit J-A-like isoform X1 [Gigantopelta aegis]|uniref:eukaryotic translation initiation factor 3 subunit J-A-like isoform X1 n=1 Tax=Gigantopelta aegis TaxID=1735272 RepID=UPI001B88A909|nr:eukaryotic translation initiation factor 3 subunit J-A-like isoform X1 [Gigantopelta aegis]